MEQTVEIEQVKTKALTFPDQAKTIVVRDQESLGLANQFFLEIRALRKEIASVFDPIINKQKEAKRKADEARAEAVFQKDKAEAPLVVAEAYLNGQITDYKREQDRKRAEEEERNRQEAIKVEMERRKKEEETRLAQAVELEKSGAHQEADALIEENIEAQAEPVQVYVPPPQTEKVELNGMSTVTTWHAEVTDLKALCLAVGQGRCPLAYVEANLPALNKQATSLQSEMKIPGVKAVSVTKARITGRR
jgi:hypothetical protein